MTSPVQGSLGIVTTQRARLFDSTHPLHLASGARLDEVHVAFETYGTLSPARDNAIFVCHALTGDAHAAGWHEDARRPGWWDTLIGPGKPLDTDRYFVICPNLLGGCQGSTGPSSLNPATGRPYGLDFPLLAMSDFVTVHRALLAHLGIDRLLACVGGSLGGMQVLQWSLDHPDEVANALIIASSGRLTAQNIAFSAVARAAIMRDPGFSAGQYASAGTNPDLGLSIARMMAHITYLSEEGMTEKFGRSAHPDAANPGFGIDFAVESYLNHQGRTFLSRFDALSYLYLTRVMDFFDPFQGDEPVSSEVVDATRFLVVSFDSDWRFSTRHSREIVRRLEARGAHVTFRDIRSPWGHDSFLLTIPDYHATVDAFVARGYEEVTRR